MMRLSFVILGCLALGAGICQEVLAGSLGPLRPPISPPPAKTAPVPFKPPTASSSQQPPGAETPATTSSSSATESSVPGSGATRPPVTPTSGADDNLIQLNFPENVEVKVLIDYVARRLGMNLIYDDAIVHKKVSILAAAKVPKDSLLGLLQSVLKATGLAMVDGDQPGWKRIIPAQSLLAVTDKIERDPERLAAADKAVPVTQIFQLKHVTTASLDPIIKPFLGTQGSNSLPIPDRNMVIVTDYAENLRRVADVIDLFDRPATLAKIQFIAVQNWDAAELAAQVTTLLRERQRTAGSEKSAQMQVTLTAEPKSNRIVLIAADGAEGPRPGTDSATRCGHDGRDADLPVPERLPRPHR